MVRATAVAHHRLVLLSRESTGTAKNAVGTNHRNGKINCS
jgi:hypothetical protein